MYNYGKINNCFSDSVVVGFSDSVVVAQDPIDDNLGSIQFLLLTKYVQSQCTLD